MVFPVAVRPARQALPELLQAAGNSSRAGGLAPEPPRSPRRTGRSRLLNQQQVTPSASSLPSPFPCSPSYLSPIVSSSGTASMYPPWPPQAPERTRQPHLQERIPHSQIWAFPASPTHTCTYTSSHAQASFCGARVGQAPPWIQREFRKRSECEDSFDYVPFVCFTDSFFFHAGSQLQVQVMRCFDVSAMLV